MSDHLPTASLDMLRLRARLLAAARRFFDHRGYFEVDTPLLSHDRVVDPHLAPFQVNGANPAVYLQTSPEFAMKRLLSAGATAIYQIGHVFRAGELGQRHNPEFTMIEWYRVGDTHWEQMQVVEDLVLAAFAEVAESWPQTPQRWTVPAGPFLRTTYRDAFRKYAGVDALGMPTSELIRLCDDRGVVVPESMSPDDRDGWLNLLLAELIEPQLGRARPEFLIDYPASQAAIARIREDELPVAERFELYIAGIELCNGYHELTDPVELRRRMSEESQRLVDAGEPPLVMSNRLLAAMEASLPPCAGVALGFDRLLMVATGASSIADVLAFPFPRA
ncbi:MAG: EF-P lysine aminoacylase GenX [Planctomycetes bacterium]|nr:EF-P lysine aminoacylase GenX [Planctomycetota bacterium]